MGGITGKKFGAGSLHGCLHAYPAWIEATHPKNSSHGQAVRLLFCSFLFNASAQAASTARLGCMQNWLGSPKSASSWQMTVSCLRQITNCHPHRRTSNASALGTSVGTMHGQPGTWPAGRQRCNRLFLLAPCAMRIQNGIERKVLCFNKITYCYKIYYFIPNYKLL